MDTIKPCRNCNNRCIDSLRTHPEQICRPCLKILSRTICMYCQKDFHQVQALSNCEKSICWKCEASQKEHGEPLPCHFCCQKAAFGQAICRHCQKDSEKYGTPIECDSCRKKCAFLKPSDLKQKVGGKNLCYLCTRSYKLMQHRNKKQNQHNKSPTNAIDITWSSAKRSFDETIKDDDDPPHKRQKLSPNDGATSVNPMCFGCKSMKHTFDEYKAQMQCKLGETAKRVDDYQRMADKAKRKADQYRREKLSAVERIGELNGELEKERRKYHRDISVKREHSETENKRLRCQLTTAQIEVRETQSRLTQLEKNNESLKRNKKELEKVQKMRSNEEKEWDKKYQKLEEKLNSKRDKLKNWKVSYDKMNELAKQNEDKLTREMSQMRDTLERTQQQLNSIKENAKGTETKYCALLKEKSAQMNQMKMQNDGLNDKLMQLNDELKTQKMQQMDRPNKQYQQQQQQQPMHQQNYQQRVMQQIVDSLSPTERDKLHSMNRAEQEKWFQSKMMQHQQQMQHMQQQQHNTQQQHQRHAPPPQHNELSKQSSNNESTNQNNTNQSNANQQNVAAAAAAANNGEQQKQPPAPAISSAAQQNKPQQQQAQFAANLTQQQMVSLTQRGYTVQQSPNQRGYLIIPPQPQQQQQQPTYNQAMFIQPQYQMSSALYGNSAAAMLMPQQQIYIQQQPQKNANQQTQQY